jgi:aquaporin Z
MELFKKSIAEYIGSFILVFIACGYACIDGGNNVIGISLVFGLVVAGLSYLFGKISGAHLNPAVSLASLINEKMSLKDFSAYVGCQILGTFTGALAIFGLAKFFNFDLAGDACTYVINHKAGLTTETVVESLLVEFFLTFLFIYIVLSIGNTKTRLKNYSSLIVGATIFFLVLVGINLTGCSLNPARSLATSLGTAIFNHDLEALSQVWVFFVGPLGGAALSAYLYKRLHRDVIVRVI